MYYQKNDFIQVKENKDMYKQSVHFGVAKKSELIVPLFGHPKVFHKKYGEGTVKYVDGDFLTVEFAEATVVICKSIARKTGIMTLPEEDDKNFV
jgi:hypothetical protein